MRSIRGIWTIVFLGPLMMANVANAGDDYRCTIDRVSLAQGDSGPVYDLYRESYIGKEFTIERASGVMAGVLHNAYVTKPQVINLGSKDNSYLVVTTMRLEEGAGASSNIYALTILEYKQGKKKPFVFLRNDEVFFGQCEHF